MPLISLGSLFGTLEPGQQDQVLREYGEEAAARYKSYYELLTGDSMGLRDLIGDDALNAFRARSPEEWAELQNHDPERMKAALREWATLQENADKRLNRMIDRVSGDSVKSLVRSRVTEKQATEKIAQSLPRPQF